MQKRRSLSYACFTKACLNEARASFYAEFKEQPDSISLGCTSYINMVTKDGISTVEGLDVIAIQSDTHFDFMLCKDQNILAFNLQKYKSTLQKVIDLVGPEYTLIYDGADYGVIYLHSINGQTRFGDHQSIDRNLEDLLTFLEAKQMETEEQVDKAFDRFKECYGQ